MTRFAVFISGRGSNLKAIIDAVQKGQIKGELALVVSSNPKAGGLKFAQDAGIKTVIVDPHSYTNPQSVDRDMVIQLKEHKIDLIVLAGYMRLLTPFFVKTYHRQIINIHPSILPAFKGTEGIKDAFTYGVKVTGVTVHFVDEKMDAGPIILQKAISVAENETLESLEEKIHKVEHEIYPKAIQLFVDGKLKVKGRKVQVLP